MLFTFRRETDGRETILVHNITIAKTDGPESFEWLNSFPGITAEHVRDAAVMADQAGFWTRYETEGTHSWGEIIRIAPNEVTVGDGWIEVVVPDVLGKSESHSRGQGAARSNEVTVDVYVAETTSTIFTVDTSEDQS